MTYLEFAETFLAFFGAIFGVYWICLGVVDAVFRRFRLM